MDPSVIDKARLRAALLQKLQEDLDVVTAAHKASQDGVTHEESRPEGIKDMRSTETSYLARGQAKRVLELREEVALLERFTLRSFAPDGPVAPSALVELESETGTTQLYWVVPAGGGVRLTFVGVELTIVTPRSPLGRALAGRRVGETVELATPQGVREQLIARIA